MNEQRVNDANVKKVIRQAPEAEMNWGLWAPQVCGCHGCVIAKGVWVPRVCGRHGCVGAMGVWVPWVCGCHGFVGVTGMW